MVLAQINAYLQSHSIIVFIYHMNNSVDKLTAGSETGEKLRLNNRQIGYLLRESFRFSQGDEGAQNAFLGLASFIVDTDRVTKADEAEIIAAFKSALMGADFAEGLVVFPGERYELSNHPSVSENMRNDRFLKQDGSLPLKEMKSGAHMKLVQPLEDKKIVEYLYTLLDPSHLQMSETDLMETYISNTIRRDIKYTFDKATTPPEYADMVNRNGRPEDRSIDEADYDNPRKDKYFSYIAFFLVKGGKLPEDKVLNGVVDNLLARVRKSPLFQKLLLGKEISVLFEAPLTLQNAFDELIKVYNRNHKIGQIDLAALRSS